MLLARQPHCSSAAAGSRRISSGCLHAAASSPWCSRASCLQLHSRQAAAASTSSVSSNGRAAAFVCRDAPRPMWARKPPPPEAPQLSGSALSSLITNQIMASDSIVALSDVFNEWDGSFDYINTAAATVRFAKLSRRGEGGELLQLLVRKWLQVLPEAGVRQYSNILWACVTLSKQHQQQVNKMWGPTWAAFMQQIERQSGEELVSQNIANAVYAAARLRKQPTTAELQLLMQTFLRPQVLADAAPQASANLVWAISELSQPPKWQGGVSEQDLQQLLGEQQLRVLADGTAQNVSNVLLALAVDHMVVGKSPLVERTFAQQCSTQLLSLVSKSISSWEPQHIANTMWSTAELGLSADVFVVKAVQAAQVWVSVSANRDLTQAAQACALLQYKDEAFLTLLLRQATGLLQQQQQQGKPLGIRLLSRADRATLAALVAASVAQLDMQQLAGVVRDLIASSRVGQQAQSHPSNLRRLWLVHAWLLQHQLLDCRGLTGLATQQQLRQGQQEAAVYGTGLEAS